MTDTPSNQHGYPMQQTPFSGNTPETAIQFMIDQAIARISGAQLVKITKVSTQGQVGPVGKVSVQVLTKTMDGQGNTFSHGAIHNIPFFRLQGGSGKAVIMDPKVGDIGIAIFADRDISGVKKNKKESPPGSYRKHDMADGLYIGGFLGETPTCYIRFTDDNKIIASVGEGSPFQWVVASDHVQMKRKGNAALHVTITDSAILSGMAITIAPDPFPGD